MTRSRSDERGATLVELLTVLAISAVVMTFVTGTVVHALRTQRHDTAQVAALGDAKIAFERVTRDIRGADPLRVAAVDRIRLDVKGPNGGRTVAYERVGDALVATTAGASAPRTLVDGLATGEPVFQYHLADGSTVTGEQAVDPRSVRAITVRLRLDTSDAGRVVDLENRVLLRNATS